MKKSILNPILGLIICNMFIFSQTAMIDIDEYPKECRVYNIRITKKNAKIVAAERSDFKYWDITKEERKNAGKYKKYYEDTFRDKYKSMNANELLIFAKDVLHNIEASIDKNKPAPDQDNDRINYWENDPQKTVEVLFASAIIASHKAKNAKDGHHTTSVGSSCRELTFDEGRKYLSELSRWVDHIFNTASSEHIAHLIHAINYQDHPYIAGAWLNLAGDKVLLSPNVDKDEWLGVFARKCTTIPDNYEFFVPYFVGDGRDANVKKGFFWNKFVGLLVGSVIFFAGLYASSYRVFARLSASYYNARNDRR